jgi:hypothetical protein
MIEIKAPQTYTLDKTSLFLAGSIEMGKAIDWQAETVERLKNKDIIILNPRRLQWDASWKQSMENEILCEQIKWELEALEAADVVLFHFLGATYSPISLLELGLCARKKNVFVHCPEEYWREPNVELVCQRYHLPFFKDFEALLEALSQKIS